MFDAEAPSAAPPPRRFWLATTEGPGFSGGIGVYTHQTARMLAGAGVAVTVLHHDPSVGDPVVGYRDGYRLIRFASRDLARRPIPHANLRGPLRASAETCALLRDLIAAEGAPDAVEVQDYGALAHAFLKHRLIHADQAWPRVVLTAHRPNAHCALIDGEGVDEHRAAFLADAERWCYAAADAVFAPCAFIAPALARIGFPTADAKVVFNPYDAGDLDALAPEPSLEPERIALEAALHTAAEPLLYFGKLQAQKGAPDLLAALDALHTEGEAPPVWLFGRDAFLAGTPTTAFDALGRRHARLFDGGHARYFGGYGPAEMKALCGEHPIVALPYREDCLPYAFVEAVLCGAIPLTRANGGQAELIPAELHGLLLIDFDRPDGLGERLAALRGLGPLARRALSRRLQAAVRARTDPAAVLPAKLAALAGVATRYGDRRYPFVHGPSQVFGPPEPQTRKRLAAAVPQRGATRSLRRASPGPARPADLVSVVVPYFDMHAFVDETLAAIEAQDHDAVEVILVDDGSRTPAARDKLDAILAAPRRFPTTVLRKTNGGLADARNAGARFARGDYLYFLDADDVIHPSTLSRALRLLKRFDNVGYVGAGLKEFGDSDGEWAVFDVDGPYIAFHNLQICGIR
jgi:glycogen(starch) synthase